MNDGIGGDEVEAAAAGFQRDEEERDFAGLEGTHGFGAVAGVAAQFHVRDAGFDEAGLDEVQHGGELREHQDAAAFGDQLVDHFHEVVELGRALRAAIAAAEFDQAGVATGLAEFEQGVEHDEMCIRDSSGTSSCTDEEGRGAAGPAEHEQAVFPAGEA